MLHLLSYGILLGYTSPKSYSMFDKELRRPYPALWGSYASIFPYLLCPIWKRPRPSNRSGCNFSLYYDSAPFHFRKCLHLWEDTRVLTHCSAFFLTRTVCFKFFSTMAEAGESLGGHSCYNLVAPEQNVCVSIGWGAAILLMCLEQLLWVGCKE